MLTDEIRLDFIVGEAAGRSIRPRKPIGIDVVGAVGVGPLPRHLGDWVGQREVPVVGEVIPEDEEGGARGLLLMADGRGWPGLHAIGIQNEQEEDEAEGGRKKLHRFRRRFCVAEADRSTTTAGQLFRQRKTRN